MQQGRQFMISDRFKVSTGSDNKSTVVRLWIGNRFLMLTIPATVPFISVTKQEGASSSTIRVTEQEEFIKELDQVLGWINEDQEIKEVDP